MAAGTVVAGSNVLDAVGVGAQLITLAETVAGGVIRIVNGDGLPAELLHDGEAWDVGRAVADIDHIRKGHGAQVGRHMVVHVLTEIEEALVDAEKILRLLGVGDDALGEGDAAFVIGGELAPEDFLHKRLQRTAINQRLHAAGKDVVLNADANSVVGIAEKQMQLVKHAGEPRIKLEVGP